MAPASNISHLMTKLKELHTELAGGEKNKEDEEDSEIDEFTRSKKRLARDVAAIRKKIAERDELLEKSGTSDKNESVKLSAEIRRDIRAVKEQAESLSDIHKASVNMSEKKKKGAPSPDDIEHQSDVVNLVYKHIEECENLEKKRYNKTDAASSRSAMMANSRSVKRSAQTTDLKDIDDPEVTAGLMQLKKKDEQIDKDLELISAGVGRLKNIAVDMNTEIKMQSVMVEEITTKVETTTDHLHDINGKLSDILEQAGGASRYITNLILLVLLLAIGGVIYKMVTSSDAAADAKEKAAAKSPAKSSRRLMSLQDLPLFIIEELW